MPPKTRRPLGADIQHTDDAMNALKKMAGEKRSQGASTRKELLLEHPRKSVTARIPMPIFMALSSLARHEQAEAELRYMDTGVKEPKVTIHSIIMRALEDFTRNNEQELKRGKHWNPHLEELLEALDGAE